ncbi:hypothetical protein PEBR_17453 [Penicillium brasilianum]|uniref:Aminoglycoside phosphotransferase domain-containing protein n=1 Tax=Penicillium brasilianum TaxID=104259 RepID=A0A1S9RQ18_PENBI|nr:hypothetical protein PEBR_17453 [Penicillium brasilianum]
MLGRTQYQPREFHFSRDIATLIQRRAVIFFLTIIAPVRLSTDRAQTTMNTPFDIPFYAADLPHPLPTSAEIENAPDIFLDYGERRVVAVGQLFVVKFGLGVNLIEGENMLFVQGSTDVPVPRVYALYSDPNTRRNYIVMERIIGRTLLSAWPQFTTPEKQLIVGELRRYFDELRHLPPPKYFGSFGNRPLQMGYFGPRNQIRW